MLIVQASMMAKPGQRERAIRVFRSAMQGSQAEPGCNTYRFTVDLDNADLFHIIELWEDEKALLAHLRGDAFKSFIAAAGEIIDPLGMSAYLGEMAPYQFPTA